MYIEICVPVYNEEKILEKNILQLLNFCQNKNYPFSWKIIIVINGSNDQSLAISQALENKYPDKINFVNYEDGGKGGAIKKYFLTSPADILVYMDVDLAVDLGSLDNLIHPIINKKAQIVMGSRLLPNSKTDRSFLRELSSQIYNFFSRIILKHNFSDLQCGFKAMEKSAFQKISPHIKNKKWFFDTELIAYAKLLGFKIMEIPIDWSENRYEQRKSKVNLFSESAKFIYNLFKLKKELKSSKN